MRIVLGYGADQAEEGLLRVGLGDRIELAVCTDQHGRLNVAALPVDLAARDVEGSTRADDCGSAGRQVDGAAGQITLEHIALNRGQVPGQISERRTDPCRSVAACP